MADLSTLTSRRRLPRDGTKRWTRLANGRGLGYRRSRAAAGTWYVRLYVGRSAYRMLSLGTADDEAPADGRDVLSYRQALDQAIQWEPEEVAVAERKRQALTVRAVVARYLEWYEAHRKAYDEVRNQFDVHVLPELGEVRVDQLTPDRLRRWHQGIASKPARLRGGQTREARTEDQKRARKVTANHALKSLKAALNRAVEDGVIPGPGVWAIVKPFRGVDVARGALPRAGWRLIPPWAGCPAQPRGRAASAGAIRSGKLLMRKLTRGAGARCEALVDLDASRL